MRAKKCLAAALAALTAFCFTACGPDDNGGGENNDPVTDNVHFAVSGDTATVSWDKKSGASGYTVEKSPSRYGEYEFVEYLPSSATEFETNDISSYYKISAMMDGGSSVEVGTYSYETELFGENTYVYAPTDDMQKIQEDFDAFYEMTYDQSNGVARGEFREDRFAALFKAGEYEISADVGYYTALYGLGNVPDDVVLDGMNVTSNVSLCNFWRTAENLAVDSDITWAVSQATSLRRIHAKHDLALWKDDSTSGGFIADTKVDGVVSSGSQQQFLSRNSEYGGWSGCVWNMAFVGVEGNGIPGNSWSGTGSNFTNIETSGALREKPFLTYDDTHGYRVFVPSATNGARGVSWAAQGGTAGSYVSLNEFYVARSDRDDAKTINAALASGKHVLFTAGIYEIDEPIEVKNADTIILGLGLATLRASSKNTDTVMRVADVGGVCVGGILFDAGKSSETLLEVGSAESAKSAGSPITLNDLFFRVGGWTYDPVSVGTCVTIGANNVIGDNLWIWRADHSATRIQSTGLFKGIGWTQNPSDTGIIIEGDNATFYGLFVEHFLKYQTIWRGNGGNTYFYQSELPYDVPSFGAWTPDGTACGYASYYVDPQVETHTARALGVYSYLRDAAVTLDSGIVCPQKDGVRFEHMVTVWLNGVSSSAVNSIINGAGDAATNGHRVSVLEAYPLSE